MTRATSRPSTAAAPAPRPRSKNPPAPAPVPAPVTPTGPRKVKYPKLMTTLLVASNTEGARFLTADQAKKFLGWEEVAVKDDSVLFTDMTGKFVRCRNVVNNRGFDRDVTLGYAQDILNRRWSDSRNDPGEGGEPLTVNGETIVLNRYGDVESGQKRLVALVFAKQIWEGKQKHHWRELWPEEPTIECVIFYGISKNPRTIRTLDNVQTRTGADVLSTSGFFRDRGPGDRRKLCRYLEHATRYLWSRTGREDDAFSARLTNSEIVDFVTRHARLVEAVRHLAKEDRTVKGSAGAASAVSSYLSPAYAAALCYLFGCSASGGPDGLRDGRGRLVDYADAEPAANEDVLDWSRWDKAKSFFSDLARRSREFAAVRGASRPVGGTRGNLIRAPILMKQGGGSLLERVSLLTKAWGHYAAGEGLTDKRLALGYEVSYDEEGNFLAARLLHPPSCGGIDVGSATPDGRAEEGEGGEEDGGVEDGPETEVVESNGDPTLEDAGDEVGEPTEQEVAEIEARKEAERRRGLEELRNGGPPKPTPHPRPKAPSASPGPKPAPAPERPATLGDEIDEIKGRFPGRLCLFRRGDDLVAWGQDASSVAKSLGRVSSLKLGVLSTEVPLGSAASAIGKLIEDGYKVAVLRQSAVGEPWEGEDGRDYLDRLSGIAPAPKAAAPPPPVDPKPGPGPEPEPAAEEAPAKPKAPPRPRPRKPAKK